MKYAKYISPTQVKYPHPSEFEGIPNYLSNDKALRSKGYLPLLDVPSEQPGKILVLTGFEVEARTVSKDVVRYVQTFDNSSTGGKLEEQIVKEERDASVIHVISYRYEDIEPAVEINSERDETERKIVQLILQLARKYDAVSDILSMEDINIPSLVDLATEKGVSEQELGALIMAITPLKWQLEAVEGLLWSECWQGLKSRFATYLGELADA